MHLTSGIKGFLSTVPKGLVFVHPSHPHTMHHFQPRTTTQQIGTDFSTQYHRFTSFRCEHADGSGTREAPSEEGGGDISQMLILPYEYKRHHVTLLYMA